jgi:chromosome segregation ATPase
MANGSNHDRLAQRIEDLERRIEDRAARRDATDAEAREIIADLAARLGNTEGAVAETRAGIGALQSVKPPGFLALAGPAIAASVMVGSLGGFVLSQAIGPVKERIEILADSVELVRDRQDNVRQRVAHIEGRLPEIDERLDDVDKLGSRRWAKEK